MAFYVFIFLLLGISNGLLLDDPDVLRNRLNTLESEMASLKNSFNQEVTKLSDTVKHLEQQLVLKSNPGSGDTYIRWARTGCPGNGTTLVYEGYMAGGYYTDTGGPADPVCLPKDPDFLKTSGGDSARIYGTEFQSNFFGPHSINEDVPCAVCEVSHGSTSIMIPGKTKCYKGWNVEYYGNLAAGYRTNSNHASAYLCIDLQPEYVASGENDKDGNLLYEVVAKCGSLPCPPYHENYPISCVVCSK